MGTPDWVETYPHHSETADRMIRYIVCNNLDTLLWLANLDTLEIHVMFSTTRSYTTPDLLFIDLDPEPPATTADAAATALLVHDRLASQGVRISVKTSGKRGLHLVTPLVHGLTFQEVRGFIHDMSRDLAREHAFHRLRGPGPLEPRGRSSSIPR